MLSETRFQVDALAYAGALPFGACALWAASGVGPVAGLGGPQAVAAGYALAILCFVAGTQWGLYLARPGAAPDNLLISSNMVTVAGWLAFLAAPASVALIVCAIGFLILLAYDLRLMRAGGATPRYFATRRNVTSIVVPLLLVAALA